MKKTFLKVFLTITFVTIFFIVRFEFPSINKDRLVESFKSISLINNADTSEQIKPDISFEQTDHHITTFQNEIKSSPVKQPSQSEYDEWQILNNNVFIRIKTAFYFVDENKISIFLACLDEIFANNLNYLKLSVTITLYDKTNLSKKLSQINLENVQIHAFTRKKPYQTNGELSAFLGFTDLNKTLSLDLLTQIQMNLDISAFDTKSNVTTSTQPGSIIVAIKHRYTQARSIYFCAEPSYLEERDHAYMKWVIELNRQIGFDRIIISNSSVPNTKLYNTIFEKNKDFVDVVQYNYLPNFMQPNSSKRFVNHYEDLAVNGDFFGNNIQYIMPMDAMAYTECLFNNLDKTGHIFVGDIDETFIPSKLSKFDTKKQSIEVLTRLNLKNENDVENFQKDFLSEENCINSLESNQTFLRSYLDGMYKNLSISEKSSIFFLQVTFLKEDLSDEIFTQMELAIANYSHNTTKFPIKFRVFKKHVATKTKSFVFNDSAYDANFVISINSESELKYAQSLLSIYKFIMRPFLKENSLYLQNESERFKRFLHLDMLGYGAGKSFLNTKITAFMENAHV
jgi:hypothetical protein